jgi:RHS repeat-associated protein
MREKGRGEGGVGRGRHFPADTAPPLATMPAMLAQLAFPRRPAAASRRAPGHGPEHSLRRQAPCGFSRRQKRSTIDPYGKVTICNPDGSEKTGVARVCSAYGNPFFFTGRRNDDETRWFDSSKPAGKEWQQGLMQFRFRYYDTGLGRFIGRDPLGYDGGFNTYQYVRSSPSKFADPFGLEEHAFKEGKMSFQSTTPTLLNVAQYKFTATITFTPDPDECGCEKIVWIQWMYAGNRAGHDTKYTGGKDHPYYNFNPLDAPHTARETRPGGTSPLTAKPGEDYSADLGVSGSSTLGSQTKNIPATLIDNPERRENTTWQSCVQCFDDKRWLGCVVWQYMHDNKTKEGGSSVSVSGFFEEPINPAPLPKKWAPTK